ncbi:MAG: aminotransferase class III-fold pyridoxal phosphate-dependent enzyme [Actinobacteria bacterium]|nr:aminotransferase class III-fold pyridoxal phosphate-dependent enzyme [Actinomycetota bacterium]
MIAAWHPFSDMAAVSANGQFVLTEGRGTQVFDDRGREFLDFTAGLWFANVGHGRAEIAEAVGRQAGRLAHYSMFGDMVDEPAVSLAERVAALAPVADSRVFFTSGGSDSVDTGLKIVRRYWQVMGQPERQIVLTRDHAYHGMHWAGTKLSGLDPNREGWGDLGDDTVRVSWNNADDLAETIERVGAHRIAAFFCEPVIGAGGVRFAGDQYLKEAREVCREHDVLWVSDEVISGFGRTGDWFASGRFGIDPDLILTAKGITSGYIPMGAVIVAPRVAEPFYNGTAGVFRHGYTYSGHAVAAAAAHSNLDIIEREGLVERVRVLEGPLHEQLASLVEHPLVSEVRAGVGLLGAVQVDPAVLATDPGLTSRVVMSMRERGVLSRALIDGSIQVSPPFVIDIEQIGLAVDVIGASLDEYLPR